MIIVETPTFTRRIADLLDAESYRLLQMELAQNPAKGELIRGTGGLRKIRWSGSGRGKRGGTRMIYYWAERQEILLMLLVYAKNVQDDLTAEQRKALGKLVRKELG